MLVNVSMTNYVMVHRKVLHLDIKISWKIHCNTITLNFSWIWAWNPTVCSPLNYYHEIFWISEQVNTIRCYDITMWQNGPLNFVFIHNKWSFQNVHLIVNLLNRPFSRAFQATNSICYCSLRPIYMNKISLVEGLLLCNKMS